MTRRRLDMEQENAQTTSSNAMRVKIDKFAGSYAGQARRKLEIAIAPDFARLLAHLVRAEKLTGGVRDQLDTGESWGPRYHRDITSAEKDVRKADNVIDTLRRRTQGTPYAFVGLQLSDIANTNLNPAREHLWEAYQTRSGQRIDSIRNGWQQIHRALGRLNSLIKEYESTKEEFDIADRTERIKKMYRVYVENAHTHLGISQAGGSKHSMKPVEFELDEEYLKRLQEVLLMRQELLAELAKILDDDPRLLRRYMNNFQNQSDTLRLQLSKLRERQEMLARDSGAWADNQGPRREAVLAVLRKLRLEQTHEVAEATGNLAERFEAWLPFDAQDDPNDPAAEARRQVAHIAARGQELARAADKGDTELAVAEAETLYQLLRELEVAMRRLAASPDIEGVDVFAIRRILDSRKIITDVTSWLRRMREIQQGNFYNAAAIEQYQLAADTDQLAAKLSAVEQQIAGMLQQTDGTLAMTIAAKSRQLLQTLDQQVTPNQLAAAVALQQPDWQRVKTRQDAAITALSKAEQSFDEMIKAAIEEIEKLPPMDPIASLLDDPTLDEILAQLEAEGNLEEELGLPRRRSNLQVIGDWMRPGAQRSNGGGDSGTLLASRIRQELQRMQQAADRRRQAALERADKRVKEATSIANKDKTRRRPGGKSTDWNKLVAQLEPGILQGRDNLPPQEYRSAIKRYYEIVNRQSSRDADEPAESR